MTAKLFTLLSLALAVTSSPVLVTRDDAPAASAAPKPAKGTGFRGFGSGAPKSSGSANSGSTGSASSGLGSFAGLDALSNLGMMSSSDVKGDNFACKKAALLFARGTGEPGNMGYVVGPGLGNGLKKALGGDVLIQGVDYSTNFSGGGAKEMVTLVKKIHAKCPDTKIILGGYSQGAMQVHQALGSLGPDAGSIAAAVTFGDPYSNQGWGSGGIVGAVMGLGSSSGAGASSLPKSSSPKSSSTPKPATDASAAPSGGAFNPANGLIICSAADFVCGVVPNIGTSAPKQVNDGKSSSGMGHLSYSSDGSIPKAITFITGKIGA